MGIHEADAWIAREKGNASGPGKMTKSQKQTLANCQEQADEAMKKAEDLAEKGDVAGSKAEVEKSEKLREEAKEIREKATFMSAGEEVCAICGVRGSKDDASYYQAHINGNLHAAYVKIRNKAKELREKI